MRELKWQNGAGTDEHAVRIQNEQIHKLLKAVAPPPKQKKSQIHGVVIGQVSCFDEKGEPMVECPVGQALGPIAAKTLVGLGSRHTGARVALQFEQGDPEKPVIMGLLHSPAEPCPRPIQAKVDGRQVVLEGQDEVVLRCGPASITLRRNGKIIIRGRYVESRARWTNRIKGGSVKVN